MNKQASVSAVSAILNHARAVTSWVCAAELDESGKPKIRKLVRIVAVYPVDGAGRLRVAVTDWGKDGDPVHFVESANGFGYDKMTAALAGCTFGGIELGDHCDSAGRPTWRDCAQAHGWEIIGSL